MNLFFYILACKKKELEATQGIQGPPNIPKSCPNGGVTHQPKKNRLVFTDLQRRTLFAIFRETKRPSKEMQITISRQLGLEQSTVSNFFMNARRRCGDRWKDEQHMNNSQKPMRNKHNGISAGTEKSKNLISLTTL